MTRLGHRTSLPAQTPLAKDDRWLAAGLACGFATLAALTYWVVTACGSFHDDAIYVSTARSLAEGLGYNMPSLPGSPPQTKYPILYPALLAVIWKLWPDFPQNLWLMQGVTLGTGATAIGVSYLYLVRFGYTTRRTAFAVCAIAATTPFLAFVSTRTLSEAPFALLVVLALWRVESLLRTTAASRSAEVLTGIVLTLPYLCRSIGVTLVLAGLLVLIARRKPVWWVLAGVALAAGPWVIWSLTAFGQWQQNDIVGYYTDYLGSWATLAEAPGAVIGWNLAFLFTETTGLSLAGLRTGAYWLLGWRLAPVLIVIGLGTWAFVVRRALRFHLLPVFLAGYGALAVLWPWPPSRFLLPVLPMVLAYSAGLTANVIQRFLPTFHRPLVHGLFAIVLIGNVGELARFGALTRATAFPYPIMTPRPVRWTSYEQVFTWLRQHSAPTDLIASPLDTMVHVYTGRRSFRPFHHRPERLFYSAPGPDGGHAAEVIGTLTAAGTRYLTLFPIPGFEAETSFFEVAAEIRRHYPGRLIPVYLGPDPRFMVFEIR